MQTEPESNPQRARELYWRQLVQLKTESIYLRLYRDDRARWVTRLGILKAVASSGGIAAWVIWKEYAFIWGAIIAASQVADALKEVFPFSRQHKAASEHMLALDRLLIDAQLEWENVFSGHYPNDEIMNRRHKLMMLQHEAERRNFPDGLPPRNERLWMEAEQETTAYISSTYGEGAQ